MQREAAFNAEKEDLLATIQHEVEAAARERAAHTTTLSNRDAAAAAERALLVQQHRETEESFTVQRETLNGHIAGGSWTSFLFSSTYRAHYILPHYVLLILHVIWGASQYDTSPSEHS